MRNLGNEFILKKYLLKTKWRKAPRGHKDLPGAIA
jgi:hypothetical protein